MTYPQTEYVDLPESMYFSTVYGTATRFKRSILGGRYRLSDAEVAALLREEEITVQVSYGDGPPQPVPGKLAGSTFSPEPGKTVAFVGFTRTDFTRTDYAEGVWSASGEKVRFKRKWGANAHWPGYTFTDDDVATLLAGGTVGFEATKKDGSGTYEANGKLEAGEFNGRPYVGFKLLPREPRN